MADNQPRPGRKPRDPRPTPGQLSQDKRNAPPADMRRLPQPPMPK